MADTPAAIKPPWVYLDPAVSADRPLAERISHVIVDAEKDESGELKKDTINVITCDECPCAKAEGACYWVFYSVCGTAKKYADDVIDNSIASAEKSVKWSDPKLYTFGGSTSLVYLPATADTSLWYAEVRNDIQNDPCDSSVVGASLVLYKYVKAPDVTKDGNTCKLPDAASSVYPVQAPAPPPFYNCCGQLTIADYKGYSYMYDEACVQGWCNTDVVFYDKEKTRPRTGVDYEENRSIVIYQDTEDPSKTRYKRTYSLPEIDYSSIGEKSTRYLLAHYEAEDDEFCDYVFQYEDVHGNISFELTYSDGTTEIISAWTSPVTGASIKSTDADSTNNVSGSPILGYIKAHKGDTYTAGFWNNTVCAPGVRIGPGEKLRVWLDFGETPDIEKINTQWNDPDVKDPDPLPYRNCKIVDSSVCVTYRFMILATGITYNEDYDYTKDTACSDYYVMSDVLYIGTAAYPLKTSSPFTFGGYYQEGTNSSWIIWKEDNTDAPEYVGVDPTTGEGCIQIRTALAAELSDCNNDGAFMVIRLTKDNIKNGTYKWSGSTTNVTDAYGNSIGKKGTSTYGYKATLLNGTGTSAYFSTDTLLGTGKLVSHASMYPSCHPSYYSGSEYCNCSWPGNSSAKLFDDVVSDSTATGYIYKGVPKPHRPEIRITSAVNPEIYYVSEPGPGGNKASFVCNTSYGSSAAGAPGCAHEFDGVSGGSYSDILYFYGLCDTAVWRISASPFYNTGPDTCYSCMSYYDAYSNGVYGSCVHAGELGGTQVDTWNADLTIILNAYMEDVTVSDRNITGTIVSADILDYSGYSRHYVQHATLTAGKVNMPDGHYEELLVDFVTAAALEGGVYDYTNATCGTVLYEGHLEDGTPIVDAKHASMPDPISNRVASFAGDMTNATVSGVEQLKFTASMYDIITSASDGSYCVSEASFNIIGNQEFNMRSLANPIPAGSVARGNMEWGTVYVPKVYVDDERSYNLTASGGTVTDWHDSDKTKAYIIENATVSGDMTISINDIFIKGQTLISDTVDGSSPDMANVYVEGTITTTTGGTCTLKYTSSGGLRFNRLQVTADLVRVKTPYAMLHDCTLTGCRVTKNAEGKIIEVYHTQGAVCSSFSSIDIASGGTNWWNCRASAGRIYGTNLVGYSKFTDSATVTALSGMRPLNAGTVYMWGDAIHATADSITKRYSNYLDFKNPVSYMRFDASCVVQHNGVAYTITHQTAGRSIGVIAETMKHNVLPYRLTWPYACLGTMFLDPAVSCGSSGDMAIDFVSFEGCDADTPELTCDRRSAIDIDVTYTVVLPKMVTIKSTKDTTILADSGHARTLQCVARFKDVHPMNLMPEPGHRIILKLDPVTRDNYGDGGVMYNEPAWEVTVEPDTYGVYQSYARIAIEGYEDKFRIVLYDTPIFTYHGDRIYGPVEDVYAFRAGSCFTYSGGSSDWQNSKACFALNNYTNYPSAADMNDYSLGATELTLVQDSRTAPRINGVPLGNFTLHQTFSGYHRAVNHTSWQYDNYAFSTNWVHWDRCGTGRYEGTGDLKIEINIHKRSTASEASSTVRTISRTTAPITSPILLDLPEDLR